MAPFEAASKWCRGCALLVALLTLFPCVSSTALTATATATATASAGSDVALAGQRAQGAAHNWPPFILPSLSSDQGRTWAFNETVVQRRRRRQPRLQTTPKAITTTTVTSAMGSTDAAVLSTSVSSLSNVDETAAIEMGIMFSLPPNMAEDAVESTSPQWDANSTLEAKIDSGVNNETCHGSPEYCNLTRAEYEEMLREFIYPKWPGMLLIGAHAVVFTMGLVCKTSDTYVKPAAGGLALQIMLITIRHRLATHWCALPSTPTSRCAR